MLKYRIEENKLLKIIENAPKQILSIAKEEGNSGQKSYDELKSDQWKHRKLSQSWVKYLGKSLEKYYQKNICESIYAFPSKLDLKEKLGIKQSEFLFDISVGLYKSFKSKKFESSKKVLPIHYQSKPIWQIESELAENTREIAIDFSKLIAGNAPYKMMVGPVGKKKSKYYLQDMRPLAKKITGLFYFLFIPRPNKWLNENETKRWYLHNWDNNDWKKVKEGEWIFK